MLNSDPLTSDGDEGTSSMIESATAGEVGSPTRLRKPASDTRERTTGPRALRRIRADRLDEMADLEKDLVTPLSELCEAIKRAEGDIRGQRPSDDHRCGSEGMAGPQPGALERRHPDNFAH